MKKLMTLLFLVTTVCIGQTKWRTLTFSNLSEITLPLKNVNFKIFWSKLGDIPVDEDGIIEESFEHFEEGTDVEEIWHWFE